MLMVASAYIGGLWWMRHRHRSRAIEGGRGLQYALQAGQQRGLEDHLRGELALAESGEAVSGEREWLARAQLGGLLVAEWRLEEARQVYQSSRSLKNPQLLAVTEYGRHELDVLTQGADEFKLTAIRQDRERIVATAPNEYRPVLTEAWMALEGLCLVRMGRAREAVNALQAGIAALEASPSRVVYLYHLAQAYEHIGEIPAAIENYRQAEHAFPGTRLANEAKTRLMALSPGSGVPKSTFRSLPPELPQAESHGAHNSGSRPESHPGSRPEGPNASPPTSFLDGQDAPLEEGNADHDDHDQNQSQNQVRRKNTGHS